MTKDCKVICVLGGPGAGKTTISNILHGKIPNSVTLKSGSILKHALKDGLVNDAHSVNYFIERGGLVDDEIVNKVIPARILDIAGKEGDHVIIMDGYPRTDTQFKSLLSLEVSVSGIITLEAPENILEKRCRIRNLKTDRVDDLQQPVIERIQDFQVHINGLVQEAQANNIKVKCINTSGSVEDSTTAAVDFALQLHL